MLPLRALEHATRNAEHLRALVGRILADSAMGWESPVHSAVDLHYLHQRLLDLPREAGDLVKAVTLLFTAGGVEDPNQLRQQLVALFRLQLDALRGASE